MPAVLDRYVRALRRQGYPEDQAWKIATASLSKSGKLKKKKTSKLRKMKR